MSLKGLIGSVLGGASEAYGEVASSNFRKKQELDLQRQISEMDEAKQLRIDEIRRSRDLKSDEIRRTRDVEDIGRTAAATAAATEATAETMGRAEGLAAVSRENAPGYSEAEQNRLNRMTPQQRAETSRTLAQTTGIDLANTMEYEIQDLRFKLADVTDPDLKNTLQEKLDILSDRSVAPGEKATTLANAYLRLADFYQKNLRDFAYSQEEEPRIRIMLEEILDSANSALRSANPTQAASPARPSSPGPVTPANFVPEEGQKYSFNGIIFEYRNGDFVEIKEDADEKKQTRRGVR
jgi:hypothetical protein